MIKKYFIIIILIFSLQSLTKADDIRDFEIEGISIGDSLLDYYSKDFIESQKKNYYPKSKKYFRISFRGTNLNNYEGLQFQLRAGDEKYIIHSLGGLILYENNIDECYSFKNNIVLPEIKSIFLNVKEYEFNESHEYDPTGKSITDIVFFSLDNGFITVSCTDWSEESGLIDKLSVKVYTKEFSFFIDNEAYK